MRATIDWSIGLLPVEQRALLEDLGVFATRFTLDAVEAIGAGRSWDGQGLDALSELVDASLVQQAEIGGRSTFSLLAIMREYAIGRLKERGEADLMRVAHADYYVALVGGVAPDLRDAGQPEAVRLLGLELPNLRAAARHLVYTNRLDVAGDFAWSLLVYWWISGFFSEVRLWMIELLEKQQPISQHTRAVAWFFALWGEMWQRPSDQVVAGLGECVRLFTESGDEDAAAMALAARATTRMQFPDLDAEKAEAELNEAVATLRALGDGWAESMAEVGLGFLAVVRGQIEEALAHFSRSAEVADEGQNMHTRIVAGNNRTRVLFMLGQVEAAEQEWFLTLGLSARLHYVEGAAYALEGICAVAATRGDGWRAGALAVVAATIRQSTGIFDIAGFAVHVAPLDALRERDPERVAAGERAGRRHDRRRSDRARTAGCRRDGARGPRAMVNPRPQPVIRTPDQRIRVFVSSTLRELAEERRAVRAAIERMQLAPVMFELGARPHPPRELYRSYLAQSDVFVGIYADSYGWVAPDEQISGLEDEYNLAPRGCRSSSTSRRAAPARSGSPSSSTASATTTPPPTSPSRLPKSSRTRSPTTWRRSWPNVSRSPAKTRRRRA